MKIMRSSLRQAIKFFIVFGILSILPSVLFGQTEGEEASRKIDIDAADFFDYLREDGKMIQKLSGNVELSQDSVFMYCDTAIIENEVNVFAVGSIIIQQGDSITIFADSLIYAADTKIADLTGNVILQTGDRKLFTNHLNYDLNTKTATYVEGAVLTDGQTQLRSKRGYYYVSEDQMFFKDSVEVVDTNFMLRADTLLFNTETKIVTYAGPTLISMDSSRVYCEAGFYETETNLAEFRDNAQYFGPNRRARADSIAYDGNKKEYSLKGKAQMENDDQEATADLIRYEETFDKLFLVGNADFRDSTRHIKAGAIIYDGLNETYSTRGKSTIIDEGRILEAMQVDYEEETGLGIARGDVVWTDTVENMTIICETAAYKKESGYLRATGGKRGRPLLINEMDGDKLYLAADTLVTMEKGGESGDSARILLAYRDVRVYKNDLQALCDSLAYSSADSIFHFYGNPIMWSDTSQFTADTLDMQLADNQVDKIFMKDNALILNSPDELFFNQIKGKDISVEFKEGEMDKMYVEGNAETVYYARDDLDAYIGVNKTLCSEMVLYFGNNQVERIKFITSPQSTLTPMQRAKHETLKLKGFNWETEARPKSLNDLFGELPERKIYAAPAANQVTGANTGKPGGAKGGVKKQTPKLPPKDKKN
jgi:lipopolysaccharide export system protein LptA